MSKTPNLRQAPTGPTIYAPMTLPPMKVLPTPPSRDPQLPSRTPSAPVVPNRAPMMQPQPGLTNKPGYPVK
jgi:hypothetical protein